MSINVGVNPDDVSLDFPVAPDGTYLCTVTRCEVGESKSEKNRGKPLMTVRFTPTEAIDCMVGDKTVAVEGRELFTFWAPLWKFPDNPEIDFRALKQLHRACGGQVGWGANGDVDEAAYVGQQLKVSVTVEVTDDGSKRNNVKGLFTV